MLIEIGILDIVFCVRSFAKLFLFTRQKFDIHYRDDLTFSLCLFPYMETKCLEQKPFSGHAMTVMFSYKVIV